MGYSVALSRNTIGRVLRTHYVDASGTDHTAKFAAAFAASATRLVVIRAGSYVVSSQVAYTGNVTVVCDGPVLITNAAGAMINSLFKITGKLKWSGGPCIVDGIDLAWILFHCPTVLPELSDMVWRNSLGIAGLFGRNFGGGSALNVSGSNGVGHGFMRDVVGENLGAFAWPTGCNLVADSSFELHNCQTDVQCGTATNLFGLSALSYACVRGGWFRGAATSAPNMSYTKRCEYIGGRYEGLLRGPTTGEDSTNVTIVGGISADCVYSGVSVDARSSVDATVPYTVGKVDWTVSGAPTFGVFIQASGFDVAHVRFDGSGTPGVADAVVRLTDSLNVTIGTVSARNALGRMLVQLAGGSAPAPGSSAYKTGDWVGDNTTPNPVSVVAGSTLHMQTIKYVAAAGSTEVSFLDKVVHVNSAAGVVDIDVPNATAVGADVRGHSWEVLVTDGTNIITVSRKNGGATPINGTAAFLINAGSTGTRFRIDSLGGGNYAVYIPEHFVSGSGSPNGAVVPTYIGQRYRNTSTTPDDMYVAVGMSNADWEVMT